LQSLVLYGTVRVPAGLCPSQCLLKVAQGWLHDMLVNKDVCRASVTELARLPEEELACIGPLVSVIALAYQIKQS